jgi:hypothetical protein
MAKKYYCQCVNQDTGRKIRCTLESNLCMKFKACPYDRGFANWVEYKRPKFRIIRGVINAYVLKTEK